MLRDCQQMECRGQVDQTPCLHGLTEAQKESYADLIKHLKDALCPRVEREKFYFAFDHRKLRPDEDP